MRNAVVDGPIQPSTISTSLTSGDDFQPLHIIQLRCESSRPSARFRSCSRASSSLDFAFSMSRCVTVKHAATSLKIASMSKSSSFIILKFGFGSCSDPWLFLGHTCFDSRFLAIHVHHNLNPVQTHPPTPRHAKTKKSTPSPPSGHFQIPHAAPTFRQVSDQTSLTPGSNQPAHHPTLPLSSKDTSPVASLSGRLQGIWCWRVEVWWAGVFFALGISRLWVA